MVNYETMLLIGVSLAVVFFGTRCYYESRIKRIMKNHARSDEVVGEIIGKYIELIAMNFSLVSKLNIYEKVKMLHTYLRKFDTRTGRKSIMKYHYKAWLIILINKLN